MKLKAGDQVPAQVFETVNGEQIRVPSPTGLVHLQFRRFTGCPICNVHMGQLRQRADDIKAAGIEELIFFHSHAADIRSFQTDVPFNFVADPKKVHYKRVGAETSLLYLGDWKTIKAATLGMLSGRFSLKMTAGPFGLPAEFLVEPSGVIRAAKYGKTAYDQWSVKELLSLAGTARSLVKQEAA